MGKATASNIYGEEIYDYDVLENVRRMAAYPNGLGGDVHDYRYQKVAVTHPLQFQR